eukprot:scaffold497_cov368-Prasinococcus_capsulatus_cf.AAC.9
MLGGNILAAFVQCRGEPSAASQEERFMYLVYPQLCAAASIALGLVVRVAETMDDSWAMARRLGKPLARACVAVAFVAAAAVSLSRVVALHRYYGAPMTMYRHLPHSVAVSDAGQPIATVCVGAEWHRFPSSFFFPDSSYRIGFLESGFHGLLPSVRPANPACLVRVLISGSVWAAKTLPVLPRRSWRDGVRSRLPE